MSQVVRCWKWVVQRLCAWEERKDRVYGEHSNVHQSHSQSASWDLRGVARGNGKLGCLCGKAGIFIWVCGQCYGCLLSYRQATKNYDWAHFLVCNGHMHFPVDVELMVAMPLYF